MPTVVGFSNGYCTWFFMISTSKSASKSPFIASSFETFSKTSDALDSRLQRKILEVSLLIAFQIKKKYGL
jgi:hypothetical protein